VDTVIFVEGKERVVTGHRWNAEGWFVPTGEDAAPYLDARDELGSPMSSPSSAKRRPASSTTTCGRIIGTAPGGRLSDPPQKV